MEPLERPVAPSPLLERARAWLVWFGVGRLIAASVATVVVCVGGWWLLRNPAPPTEASLPRAANEAATESGVSASTAANSAGTPDDAPPADGGSIEDAAAVGDEGRSTSVVVHVAGAVVQPGVYELREGARARDALVAAGGPTDNADWNALNLAAPVADGSRLYVPAIGEELSGPFVSGGVPLGSPAEQAGSSGGPVDVNRASAEELDALPGVGPSTAAAIITERERNGPFLNVDDLERVPGIGPAKLDAIRDLVTT